MGRRCWAEPRPSEITSRTAYTRRRALIAGGLWSARTVRSPGWMPLGLAASVPGVLATGFAAPEDARAAGAAKSPDAPKADASIWTGEKLPGKPSSLSTDEPLTPRELVSGFANFYEFGTDKEDPQQRARALQVRPWEIAVEGEVERPGSFDLDTLLKLAPMEERIYRLRCVEGWSMVIPWVGYPLSALIQTVRPTSRARFVAFETLADPKQMPGLASTVLQWPYLEGLRIDEAMHPLALLTFGAYGEVLPKPNGAPVRVIVPWKYGYKSPKSIVRIRLVAEQPPTSWNRVAADEYGFYSNVNPQVAHPRWSQASERRIGEDRSFGSQRPTTLFNGYAEQVASLYAGMDLRKFR